jgi:hypothetical protein
MKLIKTKKIKSLITLLLIAIISFSVLLGGYIFLLNNFLWSTWEYKVRDFETYKSDFQTIADLTYREFNKAPTEGYYLYVEDDPQVNLIDITRDHSIIKMNSKERESLEKIVAKAFKHGDMAYLSVIRVYENQVEFEIENGQYSLIYRKDEHKPKFLNKSSYAKGSFKLKKISDHWYHARFVED